MSSSSTRKSVNESIWVAKLRELWGRKFEYAALMYNTIAYRFSSKRETDCSLYVFQCLQTFLLFSDRGNWRNNNTSNHEFSFKMSVWPCHGIDSGKNNVQVWQTVQVLYFGAREHLFIYLFIIFYTFVKLCGCQCIWDLKFEEYWEECDQLSDTHVIVKGLNPGVISKVEWAWSSGSK